MRQNAQLRVKTRAARTGRLSGVSLAGLALSLCSATLSAQTPSQANEPNVTSAISGLPKPAASPKKITKNQRKAEDAYITGARLLDHHDMAGAEREFALAAELAPDESVYSLALASVREGHVTELVQTAGKERLLGHASAAETLLAQARAIDPDNSILLQHPTPGAPSASNKLHPWIIDGPRLAGPIAIQATPGTKSFHVHSSAPEVARQVATAYGLKATVDASVENKQMKFDLEDVTYGDAMHVLSQMGHLLVVPLTPSSVLVVKNDPENRLRYEHLIQETIYASGMTNEQISELGNMIKSVFEIRQISIENSFGSMVVRAPEATLNALNLTLADLLDGDSEVMIELKLYSIDKSRTTNIGATVPTQAGAYNVESAATQLVQANQSIVNQAIAQGVIPANSSNIEIAVALLESGLATSTLLTSTLAFFGGGITSTGLFSNSSATLNFALNASDTRALDDIQLRVGNRQSATFRAGSKYPITQSTYSTTAASIPGSLAGASVNGVSLASLLSSATTATVPQVQYEDLGVTLKATPTVQNSGAITIHLELKIESLAGGSIDNIPVLNNTQFTSDVTVPDGGTAYLVSNMTQNQSAAVTGIPGLSELPGFQSTPDVDRTTDTSQLLMVLTPHLVRKRAGYGAGPAIRLSLPNSATD